MNEAIVFIPLTQGKVAVIDFADFEAVRPFKWFAAKRRRRYYAARNLGVGKQIFLHQLLLPGAAQVDHKDGDGLNCRRGNLRAATNLQNAQSFQRKRAGASSDFRGVYWHKQREVWTAQIRICGKRTHLGVFAFERDAARAYDKAARQHFGEFASCNFTFGQPTT